MTLRGGTSAAGVEVTHTVGRTTTSADYTAPSGSLTIAGGETSGTITIRTQTEAALDPGGTPVVDADPGVDQRRGDGG